MKHILPFAIIITMCASWFMFGYTYRAYHYKPTQSNTIILEKLIKEFEDEKFQERERYERK